MMAVVIFNLSIFKFEREQRGFEMTEGERNQQMNHHMPSHQQLFYCK